MITRPTGFVRSSWNSSPTTLGSYAYLPPGSTPKDRVALRANLGTRIYFAGEHTSSAHPSTVHGAGLSGSASAQEIIKLNKPSIFGCCGGKPGRGTSERIVIIGAGVAGLTAAKELIDNGFTEVTVLEANSYVGGRTHTLEDAPGFESIKNTSIEMGANWVHDHTKGSKALHKELEAVGANPVYMPWNENRLLDVDGASDVDVDKLEEYFEEVMENAEKYAESQDFDMSFKIAINQSFPRNQKFSQNHLQVSLKQTITHEFGVNTSALSAWYSTSEGSDGEDAIVIGGYNKLAKSLAVGVDVKYNTSVNELIWADADGGVKITTNANSEINEAMTADRVVVCVPLPILQNEIIKITPPMPPKQWQALNRLKMGTLDKVWLHFPTPFWTTTKVVWDHVSKDINNPSVFTWCNLMPITGEPVLTGMISGEDAIKMEASTDEEVMVIIMRELQVLKDAGW